MLKNTLLLSCLLLFCGLIACKSTKNRPLDIAFTPDTSGIVIRNVDPVGMAKIRSGALQGAALQELVKVVEVSLGEDSTGLERDVPGRVLAKDDDLLFKPEMPFKKGMRYIVLTYANVKFADFESIMKNNTKFNMAPNQKVLEIL